MTMRPRFAHIRLKNGLGAWTEVAVFEVRKIGRGGEGRLNGTPRKAAASPVVFQGAAPAHGRAGARRWQRRRPREPTGVHKLAAVHSGGEQDSHRIGRIAPRWGAVFRRAVV